MNKAISNKTTLVTWRDYLVLCKPNVVALMLLTAVVGMLLATPGMVPWDIFLFGNLGIALCACSAAAVNHILDARMDAIMARTKNRPLPQGKIAAKSAMLFAFIMGLLGVVMLITLVNPLTAWLTLATLIAYAFVYTVYLKHATPQNIVIGGLAGAAPPLLGWTAVTNSIDGHALLLVLIIFAWTPPHFWALAIHRKQEYAKADIPMLPVTHGEHYTRLQILLYTILLIATTLLPYATHMSGLIYLLGASVLGIGFIYWAIVLFQNRQPDAAINTFKYSIIYLMCLFAVLLFDHYFLI